MKEPYQDIAAIPDKKYYGYVWGADEQYPTVLRGEKFDFNDIGKNAYVIEALLWSEDDTSLIVRHSGKYHITEYDLKNLSAGSVLEPVAYLPHRLGDNVKKAHFKQLWIPEKEENCENWPVLKMRALVFTGFDQH